MTQNRVAIILCTYNGERFLPMQLDSLLKQTFQNWELFIFDDGSTDSTSAIIEHYRNQYPQHGFHFVMNETNKGYAKNFIDAIAMSPADFQYYALCDQDDIWLPEKLSRAMAHLNCVPKDRAALLGTRSILVDEDENPIGFSHVFKKAPSFSNALVQSIAGGNTMVFNQATRNLIVRTDRNFSIVGQDWFLYQLVSGAGGEVIYDPKPEILYRQHRSNLMGANRGFRAKLFRFHGLLQGKFKTWNEENLKALEKNESFLTEENQKKLRLFIQARKKSMIFRLIGFLKIKLYRQSFLQNIALYVGAILNRV